MQPRFRYNRHLFGIRQGRHAHLLTGGQPCGRLHSAPIDAQLAFTAHLLDHALRQMGKYTPQPTVQPLIAIRFGDRNGLDTAH